MIEAQNTGTSRIALLRKGAAQWRDASSRVRQVARSNLADGQWPLPTIEAALENALVEFDEVAMRMTEYVNSGAAQFRILAIMPGNIIGPALCCAYAAAIAGAKLLIRSSHAERQLTGIIARQFAELDPSLAAVLQERYWVRDDWEATHAALASVDRTIVFGEDATVTAIKNAAPAEVDVVGYGTAYSIGYVPGGANLEQAAGEAARDVALFDQRGCMSPQTIYVEGDEGRAVLFGHALAHALTAINAVLPRAKVEDEEKTALHSVVRRLQATALPPKPHSLGTIICGPREHGAPQFIVAVEPFGAPVCHGFGRIVIIKSCANASQAMKAASELRDHLDTVGVWEPTTSEIESGFRACGAQRICGLGEMQRPSFGYRPRLSDFYVGKNHG